MKPSFVLYSLMVLTASAWFHPAQAVPRRRAPNQFAPNQFQPNQFQPNRRGPNRPAPGQFVPGADGADVKSLSPGDKAKSDDLMRAGLAALQSAAAALQAGNGAAALGDLRTAYDNMLAARSIYHGHRALSLKCTVRAGLVLKQNKPDSVKRAARPVGRAIAEAQFALRYW